MGSLAQHLNEACFCVTLDRGDQSLPLGQDDARAHLFADVPTFVSPAEAEAMLAAVHEIDAAMRAPSFRAAALADAGPVAQHDFGPRGAFMGYDFHLTDAGPRLIEINTNAGGAFLNAWALARQRACCTEVSAVMRPLVDVDFGAAVIDMVREEWALQRGDTPLRSMVLVDEAPEGQFLHPEFVLARDLFIAAGIACEIVDVHALSFDGEHLYAHGRRVDLVYNRLVDFALETPSAAALRAAYRAGAAVVTPNPHVHALFADKRNLVRQSQMGCAAALQAEIVTSANADALWRERRRYFFKPYAGYGGKAVYRGDKLTRAAWDSVCAGGYIAQEIAAPSVRFVATAEGRQACKADVRIYAYAGRPLIAGARLYRGQTTNFRTPGGGFSPVYRI